MYFIPPPYGRGLRGREERGKGGGRKGRGRGGGREGVGKGARNDLILTIESYA